METSDEELKVGFHSKSFTLSNRGKDFAVEKGAQKSICPICSISFVSRPALEKHMKTHSKEIPLECPYCASLFESFEAFSEHIVEHVPKPGGIVDLKVQCKLESKGTADIQTPYKLQEPKSKLLPEEESCEVLDFEEYPLIPMPIEIKASKSGLASQEDEKRYICIDCSSLNLHESRPYLGQISGDPTFAQSSGHTTHSGEKTCSCQECGERFTQIHNVRNHRKLHSSNKCMYCGVSSQLETNQRVKFHEGNKLHFCSMHYTPYVDQKEKQKLRINRSHEASLKDTLCRKLTRTESRLYNCDTCGKSFTHRTSLINHKVVHTGRKIYQCAYCGLSFGFSGNLVAHTRIHTGEKPFICHVCQKAFARSANLKEHLKTHTGEKSINCDTCGKTFISSSGYAKHRKIHTGERPHKCNVCSKSFIQIVHLNKHILTHTGEKPHECHVCHKFFRRKDTLYKHLQIHQVKK